MARDPFFWVLTAVLGAIVLLGVLTTGLPLWDQSAMVILGLGALILIVIRERRAAAVNRDDALAADVMEFDGAARMVTDTDGVILLANRKARSIWGDGHPIETLRARAPDLPVVDDTLERLGAALEAGAAERLEVPLAQDGAEPEWLRIDLRPLSLRGGRSVMMWRVADITAQKAIEDVLRRDLEDLADFLDFVPVGLFSANSDQIITEANLTFTEWIGLSSEKLKGVPWTDLLADALPEDMEESEPVEVVFSGVGGRRLPAYVMFAPYDDAGETCVRVAVVPGAMAQKGWDSALKQGEQRFQWLFDDSPVGVVLVEIDGMVSDCNAAFGAMAGRAPGEMIGMSVTALVAPEDRDEVANALAKAVSGTSGGGASGGRTEVRLDSGADTVAAMVVTPVDEDGDITGLVLHFIDTTEHKSLEIQFAQAQKMQAMGQLAGGVAHDFNNLLTAMIGYCDLLLQRHGPGDPSFADIMQVKQNANRAANLVRQLLAFSRKQPWQPRTIDVGEALAELSHLLDRLLGEKVTLHLRHGRDVGMVRVDPGQFDQVIINLAVNARDAMTKGGELTIASGVETVREPEQRGTELVPAGDYVKIEVTDTGDGIAKENLSRLFEPFFSTKETGAGTGLGLATVYGIVRQTDGFVVVDSEPGRGATFTILLPRYEQKAVAVGDAESAAMQELTSPLTEDEKAALIGDASPPPTEDEPLSPLDHEDLGPISQPPMPDLPDLSGEGTILFVEDEDAVRAFGTRALRNKGYTVHEANNGEKALEVLAGLDHVDLLITDMMMPEMDGAQLARTVQRTHPDITLLLISGYSEDIARGEFEDFPEIGFLPKPFSLDQLAAKVKAAMNRRRAQRASTD